MAMALQRHKTDMLIVGVSAGEAGRDRAGVLLAVHLFGGLRLLALESLALTRRWHARQKSLAAAATALALLIACGFLLNSG